MYRLSRFFISDVVAGENIIQNGYFPICKEGERADHGVLFAPNGSCKTTLLSFLLSVFSPAKRRFVQHLQSGGDKTLEQYLIPGRPAVVMLELVTTLEPTLFEAEPEDRVVVGQLMMRDKHDAGKVERLFFRAHDHAFFDTLRKRWEGLVNGDESRKAVRDFIAPHVDSTSSQVEWEGLLTLMGLDPWLMDRQVDFARTEGGIKDAFKFKTEEEFMSFFLGCVTDMDEAVGLRSAVEQSMEKMASRPEKKAQLKSLWSLKERIASFDTMGGKWRSARDKVKEVQRHLGEAHHLLLLSGRANRKKVAEAEAALEATHNDKAKTLRSQDLVKANILQVEARVMGDEVKACQQRVEENAILLERGKAEQAALKAAEFMAVKRKTEAEIKDGEKVLSTKGAELIPIREQIELRAAQYHVRLEEEQRVRRLQLTTLEEQKRVLSAAQVRGREEAQTLEETLKGVRTEITRHATMIDNGEEALRSLGLEGQETPVEAKTRLNESLAEMVSRKDAALAQLNELKGSLDALETQAQGHQRLLIKGEMACEQAGREVQAEAEARKTLQADPDLATLAGAMDFDPTHLDLGTRVREAVSRQGEKVHAGAMALMGLEAERDRLESMGTLAVDEETRRLLEHYLELGVTRSELKIFPEYLTALHEDPSTLAAYLNKDPGRFTGLMAASDAVIEKVLALAVPEWLCRPVVISTPCELSEVEVRVPHVIAPDDPSVYSAEHLARRLETVNAEILQRVEVAEQVGQRLKVLEGVQRSLADYQRLYPDPSAVEALSRRGEESREQVARLEEEKAKMSAERTRLHGCQEPLEKELSTLVETRGRFVEQLKQVTGWLGQYGALATWREAHQAKEQEALTLTRTLAEMAERLQAFDGEAQALLEALAEKRSELKSLDEKGGHIPLSGETPLEEAKREEALTYDLESLESLYHEACSLERQMAGELGIATLTETLQRQRNELQKVANELERCRKETAFDVSQALSLSRKGKGERDDRSAELLASIEDAMENKGRFSAKLDEGYRKLENHQERLKLLIKRGVQPTVTEDDLASREASALLDGFTLEVSQLREMVERLDAKIPELKAQLDAMAAWARDLAVGTAQVKLHEPLWDEISPRLGWPDLVGFEGTAPTGSFLTLVDECLAEAAKADSDVNTHRRTMGSAFDRLQTELRDEMLQQRLPTIVDALRRHDAETLGNQSADFIDQCNHLAKNIESDLARSEKFVKSLIDKMLEHAKECHQKLQAATKVTMPEEVYIYGGNAILKSGSRLEFMRHDEIFRSTLDHWLHELIAQGRMPEVNPKAGNVLGAELLYRLLRAASGKAHFGVRLLKCDDSGRHYEQVGKDLGSGGEALTTAVLLYSLLTSMRQRRRNKKEDLIPAFLIADNPLGVCNRSDFLDAQLKVAEAMGIQCVYFTGINDRESLGLFEHRVAIRKSDRRLRIDNTHYTCLEVVEQNVEAVDN
ncbi:hypothetical protein [Desulfoluna sp.]|uniref:hypothetical protein n=1 Tax=Desulfoluna sp. TaxID=2045199 RepID=UPI0026062A7B|nr:hypothetical protein [Desulfoluna sp.]